VKPTVLVTGGRGFIAGALVARLVADGVSVRCSVREGITAVPPSVRVFRTGALDASTDWREALDGVSAVVHCAARVHQLHDRSDDSVATYRRVNRDATMRLAEQAVTAGVRRMVFLSSIKVNGERTLPGHPFRADDPVAPTDPYAVSKREAEEGLASLAASSGLEIVVIRPPLVYGPNVKANFRNMMATLSRRMPLPFGAIRNRRSLVALPNLVDLIVAALHHPKAPGQTFLAGDPESLSTTELLRRTSLALGKAPRLIPVPESWLRLAFSIVGRRELGKRLLDSLEVDIEATCSTLDWRPPVEVDTALVDTAQHYLSREREGSSGPG
jgi:nucleoside-diphosphate-sugar epimerase